MCVHPINISRHATLGPSRTASHSVCSLHIFPLSYSHVTWLVVKTGTRLVNLEVINEDVR